MVGPGMELVSIDGAALAVEVRGSGEPVLLVQTALIADELLPLAMQPALLDGYRTILFHRRGYPGSSPVCGAGSIAQDAADCNALLTALGIRRAHIVGLSYSGAVALQFAADWLECTHSVVLIEPPPTHVPSAESFRKANSRLIEIRRADGPVAALNAFLSLLEGTRWRLDLDREIPGAAAQMERDAITFFDTDIPALLAWLFTSEDARRITCPALHISGTASGPWFAEVRQLIHAWLPQAEDVQIVDADHSLALTHSAEIASALVSFLHRNPIGRTPEF